MLQPEVGGKNRGNYEEGLSVFHPSSDEGLGQVGQAGVKPGLA